MEQNSHSMWKCSAMFLSSKREFYCLQNAAIHWGGEFSFWYGGIIPNEKWNDFVELYREIYKGSSTGAYAALHYKGAIGSNHDWTSFELLDFLEDYKGL